MMQRRPIMPTISRTQADALARQALDHKKKVDAIMGIRPGDGLIPLYGLALNPADRQLVGDALRTIKMLAEMGEHVGEQNDG